MEVAERAPAVVREGIGTAPVDIHPPQVAGDVVAAAPALEEDGAPVGRPNGPGGDFAAERQLPNYAPVRS